MANHGAGDQLKIGTHGLYEDEFGKVDGQWLIARRNVLNEFIPKRSRARESARYGRGGEGIYGSRGVARRRIEICAL